MKSSRRFFDDPRIFCEWFAWSVRRDDDLSAIESTRNSREIARDMFLAVREHVFQDRVVLRNTLTVVMPWG